MKNVMVFVVGDKQYKNPNLQTVIRAIQLQIINSIAVGWDRQDLLLVTNLDADFDVRTLMFDLEPYLDYDPGMFKYPAIKLVFDSIDDDEILYHDHDNWQTSPLEVPDYADFGVVSYVITPGTMNGGIFFVRRNALDIMDEFIKRGGKRKKRTDERHFKAFYQQYGDRITFLNSRYNVGVSRFKHRLDQALKPVMFMHVHLERAWKFSRFVNHGIATPELIAIAKELQRVDKEAKGK